MGKRTFCIESYFKRRYTSGKEVAHYIEWFCSDKTSTYANLIETADRKRRTLKDDQLKKFEDRLKKSSPPKITSNIATTVIGFLRTAQKIRLPSFGGFGGLNRAEIEISFKYSQIETVELEEIWWAIEYLDDKLREFFNTKKEDT